jgi:hypothetical protein
MGGEKTNFIPLNPVGLLVGTSIGIRYSMGEYFIYEGCEGPPSSASFVDMITLSLIFTLFLLLTYEYVVLSIGVGLCILDYGVGETSN